MALIFVTPSTTWATAGPEQLLDAIDGGQRVLDDVVEQAGGNGDRVEPHVGEDVGHGERVNQVRLPRVAHLSPVLEGRENVGPPQQFDVGFRRIASDFFEEILEANHRIRCLTDVSDAAHGFMAAFMIGTA